MTDVYTPVEDVEITEEPEGFACRADGCLRILPTEAGRKIHESRQHGLKLDVKGTANPPKSDSSDSTFKTPKPKTSAGIGKRPLLSTSTKLSATGKDLFIDLSSAAIAWGAIRYIMQTGVQLTKAEQDELIVPEANREMMFKPITDLFEQFTPGVRVMNTIAERFDYIQCAMLWKSYRDSVIAFAEAKKESQGINNGTARVSNEADNGKATSKGEAGPSYADFGDFIPNGFGSNFQA